MELTNNEIIILINYYDNLKYEENGYVDDIKQTCTDLLDRDLLATQLKRYEHRIDGYNSRISELKAELDKL